ncbi:hypothetical protein PoB_003979800 [Plakobranchus ocellatus]|uniref:Uncharacterized protein n=1 Tax=Plakobranchus ocellatus TaxID=259542 RepID=A0AAV4B2E5_9GAST|nr:hypothetical protein PoB_003979800 [Plakobranchus ocellatus]
MDSVLLRKLKKKVTGGQRAGDVKKSPNNQRLCFKYKRQVISLVTAHIQSLSEKKAGARMIATSPRGVARKDSTARAYPALEVTDNLQGDICNDLV